MKIIDFVMSKARKYTFWDFGLFKMALFSFGLAIGTYFSNFFKPYLLYIWIIFAISYVWIIIKTFTKK